MSAAPLDTLPDVADAPASQDGDLAAFVADLRTRGVELATDGDRLAVRAPRGVLREADRARLERDKPRVLALLAADAAPKVTGDDDPHSPFPLTDIQQAYWVGRSAGLELGGVGCHAYREHEAEDLDLDRLEAAWRRLVARHPALRTVFTDDGRQRVLETAPPWRLEILDLRDRDDADDVLARIREERSHHVFDPARWPLFDLRATRYRDGEGRERLRVHLGIDLLIADAASMLVLFREWGALYRDPARALPPLAATFRDHVLAEAAAADGPERRRAAAYWRDRLDTLPAAPELPLATAPSALGRPRFARRAARLDSDRWRRLAARAGERGLTPSSLVLAVWADVLAAWSRSPGFLLTLTQFRAHPTARGVVGDFTSTLLLAVDATAATFEERARRLHSRLAHDLEHDAVSGVWVERELARRRGGGAGGGSPVVFTSALGHLHAGERGAPLPLAWLGTTVHAITQTPQVWIDHHVVEDGGELVLSWDAVDGLFFPGVLDAMTGAAARLVAALADEDDVAARAWRSPLADRVAPEQLARRRAVNDTGQPRAEGLLHDAFFARAAARPEALAVATWERELSYGELAARAAALAGELVAAGARREEPVAIVLDKGWRQVVAALAVSRAGAPYLPIDAALPAARQRLLAARCGVRLTVSRPGLDVALPAGVRRLDVADEPPAADLAADLPPCPARPEDLAYVIHTSGSTGEPKGVMTEHRAALETLTDVGRRFAIGAEDRVLALSSLSFDLSVWDVFGVLGAGGAVVLPDADRLREPRHWRETAERWGVTVWNSVPALLRLVLDEEGTPGGRLRLALLSGDWIPLDLPDRLRAAVPGVRVVSLGGATEAAIWSIVHEIGAVDPAWRSIPYGRPLAAQTIHVLDARGAPCPDWVTGELWIGGAGVARGYWGDAARTAARFVDHPELGRLYRTGDLGRVQSDGTVELLGREDHQVKVQGHRIEPGEVEAALVACPGVREAVVVARGPRDGDRALVAYVVPERAAPAAADPPAEDSAAAYEPPAYEPPAYELPAPPAIVDPEARRLFTLERRGLRRDLDAGGAVALERREPSPHLAARRSARAFGRGPLPLARLAALLDAARARPERDAPLPRRAYPSAGGLYPVQVYVHARPGGVDGLAAGAWYYHPDEHALVPMAPNVEQHSVELAGAELPAAVHAAANQALFAGAAASLFLVAERAAVEPLYGDLWRDFCLLEAGYLGQLLAGEAAAHGVALCPIGALDTAVVAERLALGPTREIVHSLLLGLPQGEVSDHAALDISELRRRLGEVLPAPLVPHAFVTLPALPLSANGKVDRGALPEPTAAVPLSSSSGPATGPAGELEERVAALAAAVLERPAVGRDEGFFDIGATSLHLVRLHRRLRDELGLALEVVDLFRAPTVRRLAALAGGGATTDAVAAARRRGARREAAMRRRRGDAGGGE